MAESLAATAFQEHFKHTREEYYVGMPIAEGHFATIKHCRDKKFGKEFLLRVIHKAKVFGMDDKVLQEVEILRMMRHENVLTLRNYWENMDEMCMVMESIEVRGGRRGGEKRRGE